MKSLKTLIKLAQQKIDELLREKVMYQEKKDDLETQRQQLQDGLRREQEFITNNKNENEARSAYQNYALNIGIKQQNIDSFEEVINGKISHLADQISEAFGELKKYEILLDKKQKDELSEINRKEQIELDEIGSESHKRKSEEQI